MTKNHKRVRRLKWVFLLMTIAIALAFLPLRVEYYGRVIFFSAGNSMFVVILKTADFPENSEKEISYGWRSSIGMRSEARTTVERNPNLFTRHIAYISILKNYRYLDVRVLLWAPLLLMIFATVFLWRWERRIYLPGHCQHCSYNLTGNVSGICPECGYDT